MATTKTRSKTKVAAKPRATTGRKKAPAAQEPVATPTLEQIRVRAYYLSLERNGSGADPAADWIRAERELTMGRREA